VAAVREGRALYLRHLQQGSAAKGLAHPPFMLFPSFLPLPFPHVSFPVPNFPQPPPVLLNLPVLLIIHMPPPPLRPPPPHNQPHPPTLSPIHSPNADFSLMSLAADCIFFRLNGQIERQAASYMEE